MESFVFLQSALIFAHVLGDYNACESNADCRKISENATHCCRAFDVRSNLTCRNVSSCVGRHCALDTECGGLCCILNKCTKCPKCRSNDECQTGKACCGIRDYGECRSTCLGWSCYNDKYCAALECCNSGECVDYGCVYDKVVLTLVGAGLGISFILLVAVVVYVLFKFKRMSKRRRTVAPANLEMNETVLTMPTTYPCTDNRTTSSSQKE
jgi:hypothetical protein